VFLDISWISKKLNNAEEHIKRKLPSMYHQFKQLADIDITKEPMEVGPTTHYIMGGVLVDADTQMSSVPGLFAAGECAAGINGANRLGGNSLSDLLVFGKLAGDHAARFVKEASRPTVDPAQIDAAARDAVEPFEHGSTGEPPYAIQRDLQELMQEHVGIVRTESEMAHAVEVIGQLRARAKRAGVTGNRDYNPGWHTALDLWNLLDVAEAIARSGLERKESRGGHFREDFPNKDAEWGQQNVCVQCGPDGEMRLSRTPIREMPPELRRIIQENQ
jgi:succinate dehydrogenase / fumarate reductase flavoprotein subunit